MSSFASNLLKLQPQVESHGLRSRMAASHLLDVMKSTTRSVNQFCVCFEPRCCILLKTTSYGFQKGYYLMAQWKRPTCCGTVSNWFSLLPHKNDFLQHHDTTSHHHHQTIGVDLARLRKLTFELHNSFLPISYYFAGLLFHWLKKSFNRTEYRRACFPKIISPVFLHRRYRYSFCLAFSKWLI